MSVPAEQIAAVTEEVWTSFLGLDVVPSGVDATALATGATTGQVQISGGWNGSVLLACSAPLARLAATAMFDMTDDDVGDEEIADAIGELVNMIGGNLKGLLPGPSRLSLPSVTGGGAPDGHGGAGQIDEQVALVCQGEPLVVTLCRTPVDAA